jgi:hypothetical protein
MLQHCQFPSLTPALSVTAACKSYRCGTGPTGSAGGEDKLLHLFAGVNERLQQLAALLTRDTCALLTNTALLALPGQARFLRLPAALTAHMLRRDAATGSSSTCGVSTCRLSCAWLAASPSSPPRSYPGLRTSPTCS